VSAISGIVYVDGRTVSERTLASMEAAAPPRGLDGTTHWHDGPVGFIRIANATTPEAVGEVQPRVGAGSGIAVLFDGRLDNRDELIDLLGWQGTMAGAPDSAIVLALFERLGDVFVRRLVGDFAIALWQPRERRLLLLRSPLGWRPLLWTFDGATFAFSTEPRALVLGLGLERRLNEAVIGEYLSTRFVTKDETFWEGVQRLPSGSALALEQGRIRIWYWHDEPFEDLSHLSADEHVERFGALFDQALVATTRGIGPIGAQLSGGLDSSSIVCRATELHRAGRISRQVDAISARFPGEAQDESEYSRAVEAHLGITATVVGARPFDLDEARAWSAATYQLPLRTPALDTLYNSCVHLEATGARVILTGEGGDDWLNGSQAHWPDMLVQGRWGAMLRDGRRRWPDKPWYVPARRVFYHSVMPWISQRHRGHVLHPHLQFDSEVPDWICGDWADRIGLRDRWMADRAPIALKGFAQKSRFTVFSTGRRHVNADNALAYAESRGVEMRHPFHDLRLTRFYMGADGTALRAKGERKDILREAMRGTLPEKVRRRRDKAVFVAHMVDAFTTLLRDRSIEDLQCVQRGWTDAAGLRRILEPHQAWRAGDAGATLPPLPFGPLWSTLAMEVWLESAFKA
jgi:asparagine synthase (glutamine-hydrolysing)